MKVKTQLTYLSLSFFILTSQYAICDERIEKIHYVESHTEYIPFGSHPLISMKQLSGDPSIYRRCKAQSTPINHYVDIPFSHKFPYQFLEKGYFQTISYDNNKNFIIYRNKQSENFRVFDISSKVFLDATPISWILEDHIKTISNSEIEFIKDLMEKKLGKENHVAFLHSGDMILIVKFDQNLRKLAHWHLKLGFENIKKILFYGKKFIILLPQKIVEISYYQGFGKEKKIQEIILKREYNDMALNRNGLFMFIRGFSELLISRTSNPEAQEGVYIDKQKFHHGNFVYTGFSNFMLNKTQDVAQKPKYFYFDKEDNPSLKNIEEYKSHREIPELSIESYHKVRLFQTKYYIYYLYPKDSKIKFMEVYVKDSEFGKNLMRHHFKGHVESIDAGYTTRFPENRLVIEQQNSKFYDSRLIRIFSNFLDSSLKCEPIQGLTKDNNKTVEIEVISTASKFKLKVVFGEKPWRALTQKKDEPKSSNNNNRRNNTNTNNHKKTKYYSPSPWYIPIVKIVLFFTGGLFIFVLTLALLNWLKRKLWNENLEETENIVNTTSKEFEMNQTTQTIESETDTDMSIDSSDADFEMTI